MSFKGIKILEIYGFDDLEFLSNESLSELKILKSDMNDITIFNKIKFINIDEIKFNNIINKGFISLNIFKSIKINKIEVNETNNNNYICKLESESPKINNSFSFDDLNFLKEQILSDTKNVIIAQNILDNKQNWNFFSFNELTNSFPIFKNLKHENIKISYNNDNKYICTTKFDNNLKFNFIFDDLKFILYESFKNIRALKLSNIRLTDSIGITIYTFPELSQFYLEKCIIESINAFNEIINLKSYTIKIEPNIYKFNLESYLNYFVFDLYSNKIKYELWDSLDQKQIYLRSINTRENKIRINYESLFGFYLEIDKIDKIEKIKNFNKCWSISLINLQLNDNDISFLNNETLSQLERIELDGNNITNLNFLDNIKSKKLQKVSIKDNLINQGIEIFNNKDKNNLTLKNIEIKIKNDDENKYILSFHYSGKYDLYFDYLSDKDKNFDVFNKIYFQKNSLVLSGLKLNKIDFMTYKNLENLHSINLDNNNIEDINIFEKIEYHINNISLKNNPIRKGLCALKSKYFKCLYIELEIIKKDNEYKICSNFIYSNDSNINIEFYINNINELKDILDIKNTYIQLIKKNINDTDEIKLLEKEFLQNQNQLKSKMNCLEK